MEIEARTKEVIAEQLGVRIDDVEGPKTLREDLGGDSLDVVELVMALEEEFDLQIGDDDADKFGTVQQVVDYIAQHVK